MAGNAILVISTKQFQVTKSINHVLDILGLSGQLHRSTDSDDLREEFLVPVRQMAWLNNN